MGERRMTSEYEGGGLLPNTIFPKGADALTPEDKFRLEAMTGQDADPNAPVDPFHWFGNVRPEPVEPGPTDAQIFAEGDRYKESPPK